MEQVEYEKEGIAWSKINFSDNQPCINLLEDKGGIYSLLDEETRVPKGTDETYLDKLHNACGQNPYYVRPRTLKSTFGIKHYAGEVLYNVAGFLEKNKDAVQEEVYEIFGTSKVRNEGKS